MEENVFTRPISTDPNQSRNVFEKGQNKSINECFVLGVVALCVQFVCVIIGIFGNIY